jgi:hypothetical protein
MNELYQIHLQIDGLLLQSAQVFFIFQKDPFPGGHQYVLQIKGNKVDKIFYQIKKGIYLEPESKVIETCFWYLNDVCSDFNIKNSGAALPIFVVNNITEILKEENVVTFKGICSEKL